ncbi:MAG: hypothetical protein H0X33_01055 [Taibaiella sp.]|nr:hypothetical protein [Taibaiella sp.]
MNKPILAIALAIATFFFAGCYNNNQQDLYPVPNGTVCDSTNVTFTATIMPIMRTNCALAGCHNSATASNGYEFETYTGINKAAINGKLLGGIRHQSGNIPMPLNTPMLDACTISKVAHWVNAGAPNN